MNLEVFAIAVLALLALSSASISLLIMGLNKQLQLQREAIKAATGGIAAVFTSQGEILNEIHQLREALDNRDKTTADTTPKSLGLSPTPIKLTPPAHDPEEETRPRRRRRHHARKVEVTK